MAALRRYQYLGADWIINLKRCGLFLPMGAGKTAITLHAIKLLWNGGLVNRVLVVGTPLIVKVVWPDEIAKWTPELRYAALTDSDWRHSARVDDSPVHLITYDKLASRDVRTAKGIRTYTGLVDLFGKEWPYDVVVLDEASRVKNPRSNRHKALRSVYSSIHYLVELTGTPAGNGYMDLWALLFLIDRGERLGRYITHYRDRWFTKGYFQWILNNGADEQINKAISDVCMSLPQAITAELPNITYNPVRVPLPPKAMQAYAGLERDMLIRLKDELIRASSKAVLSNKCLQAANGAIYTEEGNWVRLHDAKLEALEDVIEESQGSPLIVAYAYKSDRQRIIDHLKKKRIRFDELNKNTVSLWNKGRIPVMLTHPASAGHGLNLQGGGSIIVWFGLTWSLELHDQMNARIHRPGQKNPVFIHYLVAENTMDELVLERLRTKRSVQDILLQAIEAKGL